MGRIKHRNVRVRGVTYPTIADVCRALDRISKGAA